MLSQCRAHSRTCIGGAERLVVDAALGLQKLGHDVDMYTSHHDRSHCFEETRDGMSITMLNLLKLMISWLNFQALCASTIYAHRSLDPSMANYTSSLPTLDSFTSPNISYEQMLQAMTCSSSTSSQRACRSFGISRGGASCSTYTSPTSSSRMGSSPASACQEEKEGC